VKVLANHPEIPVYVHFIDYMHNITDCMHIQNHRSCARFAPNGKIILVAMMDSSVKLYTDDGNLLR